MSSEPADKRSKVPAKLGYWNIRGLAQTIRYLLKYTGTEFEDVLYGPASGPDWKSDKFSLGLDFPNLPYFIEGDFKITQSKAIIHYIARKNNLYGKTERDMAMVEMVEGAVDDIKRQFTTMCYDQTIVEKREDFVKNVPTKLKWFSDFLGEKQWFVGNEITYVDFHVYEVFAVLRIFQASIFNTLPTLIKFCDQVEALPSMKEYMQSPEYIKRPVNGPTAQWK